MKIFQGEELPQPKSMLLVSVFFYLGVVHLYLVYREIHSWTNQKRTTKERKKSEQRREISRASRFCCGGVNFLPFFPLLCFVRTIVRDLVSVPWTTPFNDLFCSSLNEKTWSWNWNWYLDDNFNSLKKITWHPFKRTWKLLLSVLFAYFLLLFRLQLKQTTLLPWQVQKIPTIKTWSMWVIRTYFETKWSNTVDPTSSNVKNPFSYPPESMKRP